MLVFFFFKQKTAYEMRISDWSSDVCSSDLHAVDAAAARVGDDDDRGALLARAAGATRTVLERFGIARNFDMDDEAERRQIDAARSDVGRDADLGAAVAQIGRASGRARVCQ